jgi:hypothetical protein
MLTTLPYNCFFFFFFFCGMMIIIIIIIIIFTLLAMVLRLLELNIANNSFHIVGRAFRRIAKKNITLKLHHQI